MRVHPPFLLAATTIATYNLSASMVFGSEMAQVDRQATTPSQVGGNNSVHDNRRLRATHATAGEERAPLSGGSSSSLIERGEELTLPLLTNSHAIVNNAPVAGLRATPNAYDITNFEKYALVGDDYPGLSKNGAKKFLESTDVQHDVMKTIRLFSKDLTVRIPKDDVVARVRDPVAEGVFGKLKDAHMSTGMFQPFTLDLLKGMVTKFNVDHSKAYTLLDALVIMYGGEDKLAPALSDAKTVASSQFSAAEIQEEMMTVWIRDKRSANDVFNILKLNDLETRGLTRKNLETFDAFLYLHLRYFFDYPRYRTQLNMVGFLRYKFGDTKLLLMIKKDMEHYAYPNELMEQYVQLLLNQKISFQGIVRVFVDTGFMDATVVQLLSVGYGGVANFAQALSKAQAKAKGKSFKAKLEDLRAALKALWQQGEMKSADDVNNLPEFSSHAESSRLPISTDKESVQKRQKTK